MLLHEVPAARTHHDRRRSLVRHAVPLALLVREIELTTNRVVQRKLPFDYVRPGRARRILLVGEPHLRTRIERVDGHFAVGRSGDLDPAVVEAGPGPGDAPGVIRADGRGFGEESQIASIAEVVAHLHPCREPVVSSSGEKVVQLREEVQGFRGQYFVVATPEFGGDLNSRVHFCLSSLSGCVNENAGLWPVYVSRDVFWRGYASKSCVFEGGQWNWADSVEPASARVALCGLSTVATRSK